MRKVILLLAIAGIAACSEPIRITGKTDEQATTSGTLGSVKANNQMPDRRLDTSRRAKADTVVPRKGE
jgi:hypothetical protein